METDNDNFPDAADISYARREVAQSYLPLIIEVCLYNAPFALFYVISNTVISALLWCGFGALAIVFISLTCMSHPVVGFPHHDIKTPFRAVLLITLQIAAVAMSLLFMR